MTELVNYRITFDVSATESVRAINNRASYRLLTLPLAMSIPSTDTITVSAAAANTSTATVTVMAQVLANDVETLEGFTLGRGDTAGFNLRDLSGNQPVVGDDPIEAGARLDSNARAVAVTERLDTTNPIITATRTTAANPDATNPFVYTGTFRVVTNEEVSNLADGASYNLLRVTQSNRQGAIIAATFDITVPNASTSTAMVEFNTTLTSISTVQATTGFRLARAC